MLGVLFIALLASLVFYMEYDFYTQSTVRSGAWVVDGVARTGKRRTLSLHSGPERLAGNFAPMFVLYPAPDVGESITIRTRKLPSGGVDIKRDAFADLWVGSVFVGFISLIFAGISARRAIRT